MKTPKRKSAAGKVARKAIVKGRAKVAKKATKAKAPAKPNEATPPRVQERPRMTLGNELRAAIERSGLRAIDIVRQARLSGKTRVSQTVLSHFINKNRDIRLETADAIARVLKLHFAPVDPDADQPDMGGNSGWFFAYPK